MAVLGFGVRSWVIFKMFKIWLQSAFGKRSGDQESDSSSSKVDFLMEYYIPDYILIPDSEIESGYHIPECPVIVFVNSKSGGQLGGEMLQTCLKLLNRNQVFDLVENKPERVLDKIFSNLEKHKLNGDNLSAEILKRLRIVVAGGDGTAGWLFGVLSDLKLAKQPPIATLPLGTGNNIPFSFGWGKKNPGTDDDSVKALLEQVKFAKEMQVDSWHFVMNIKAPGESSCESLVYPELPLSLRASPADKEGYRTFRGGFWNYFSMGMDAQVSYAFHSERTQHPEKFKNQLTNQRMYAKLTCMQGWFCASLLHPSSRNIAQLANVKIMKKSGQWIDLHIPRSIRSIICLNLPSFSGGLNPWGTPSQKKLHSRDLTPPYVDDGLFEVVGFRNGWHGLILYAPNGHGTRLAQANGIRFEFHKGAADHAFMRIDGEPWKQPLPPEDSGVVVEISHSGGVSILALSPCPSSSISAPCSPPSNGGDGLEQLSEKSKKML